MKNKLGLLCLLSVILWVSSCSLPSVNKMAPEINEVKKDTKFRINLPEDHTTGYTWILNQNFDTAVLDNISTVWHGNEAGVDFNFKALSAGQTTLTLVNRKFDDTSDVKHFIVKILSE